MRRSLLLIVSIIAIVWIGPANALGQGRGRGIGLGRKSDVFVNSHDARIGRLDGRGPNLNRKCGKFVNCHDARNGRLDGRGPRITRGLFSNGVFVPKGSRVRQRMIVRDSGSDQFRRTERLNRLEMLRRERIAEQRRFGNRSGWRRP
jgi:hypothetical protein